MLVRELAEPAWRELPKTGGSTDWCGGGMRLSRIADVPDETQVEHAVRFIEHRDPYRLQVEDPLLAGSR